MRARRLHRLPHASAHLPETLSSQTLAKTLWVFEGHPWKSRSIEETTFWCPLTEVTKSRFCFTVEKVSVQKENLTFDDKINMKNKAFFAPLPFTWAADALHTRHKVTMVPWGKSLHRKFALTFYQIVIHSQLEYLVPKAFFRWHCSVFPCTVLEFVRYVNHVALSKPLSVMARKRLTDRCIDWILTALTVPVDCNINEMTGPISGKSWVLMAWM